MGWLLANAAALKIEDCRTPKSWLETTLKPPQYKKMNILSLSFVVLAMGFNELPAESDEERNDEVAKAELRARVIGCLSLARNYVMKTNLSDVIQNHPEKAAKQKIAADILHHCYINAEQPVIEEYVLLEKQEAEYVPLAQHYVFDREVFKDVKGYIGLTAGQVELYELINGIVQELYIPEDEKPYVVRPDTQCASGVLTSESCDLDNQVA